MELIYVGLAYIGAGLGAGLAVVGAGIGIGLVGAAMVEGIARQPEMANQLQTKMFIVAALVEGLALLVLIVFILVGLNMNGIVSRHNKMAANTDTATVAH